MFKECSYKFINWLEKVTNKLKDAHEETYGCIDEAYRFNKELTKRKKANKEKVKDKIKEFVYQDSIKKFNEELNDDELEIIAENFFQISKEYGKIDDMNNYIKDERFKL